jgi:hypothetical protein
VNAPEQLSMFEPESYELAALCVTHIATSRRLCDRAAVLELRGFVAAALQLRSQARKFEVDAEICDCALQFERLAGLA